MMVPMTSLLRSSLLVAFTVCALAADLKAAPASGLPAAQEPRLFDWWKKLGGKQPGESFGQLVARAAHLQLGVPYAPAASPDPEALVIDLETFDCVTLIESTLAVARCTWAGTEDVECFAREVQASRYKAGKVDGFISRLHYFSDWFDDNAKRGRVQELTPKLGGHEITVPSFFLSLHGKAHPAMARADVRAQVAELEARLSRTPSLILEREQLAKAQRHLESGDLVAIVTTKPGILISHVGFVWMDADKKPRFMHASSHHGRVLVTSEVATYVGRWPDRRGAVIARPLPPPPGDPGVALNAER